MQAAPRASARPSKEARKQLNATGKVRKFRLGRIAYQVQALKDASGLVCFEIHVITTVSQLTARANARAWPA